jgi:hypothetical protein
VKVLFIGLLIFATGCVFGPFEIHHEEGSLPKGRVNITDNCKVRGRFNGSNSNARYTCEWHIDEFFNLARKQ